MLRRKLSGTSAIRWKIYRNGEPLGHHRLRDRELLGRFHHAACAHNDPIVAFCRCMNIPARYCTGYLGDIGMAPPYGPMDFAAWFEAYIGGRWYTFDARNNMPRIGRVLMARGRDDRAPQLQRSDPRPTEWQLPPRRALP
jgi:Transglutaminase-like superfamily